MRFARMSPERITEICALPPREAAEQLRAELDVNPIGVCCTDCRTRYRVIGNLPAAQAKPCPECGGKLEVDW